MLEAARHLLCNLDLRLRARQRLRPVFNVTGRNDEVDGKSALFVYLTPAFHLPKDHPAFWYHQNLRQGMQIAQVLGEYGYCVDVVDISDTEFRPKHAYDLVLSHRFDHAGLEAAVSDKTIKVYFSSGMNHVIHNQSLRARAAYLHARTGRTLAPSKWEVEEMPFVKIADALIGFGNEAVMDTWQSVVSGPRYGFPNYGFPTIENPQRDWASAQKNFLFLGSNEQLRKGLDLLLESFATTPDLHLYVCSTYKREPDFCRAYEKELFRTPNIHACGWIDVGGKRFRELAARCAFVLLPSCAEGLPGSVTNAMYAGLIPVVTKEAGIDTGDYGTLLANDRLETIRQTVLELSQLPPKAVAARSAATRQAAEERYSEAAFLARWREIMASVTTTLRKS